MPSILSAQPAPVQDSSRPVWPLVAEDAGSLPLSIHDQTRVLLVADMMARDEQGRAKHGVPLTAHNGRDHLADAYQEAPDGAVYLRAQIERGGPRELIERTWQVYEKALEHAADVRSLITYRDVVVGA